MLDTKLKIIPNRPGCYLWVGYSNLSVKNAENPKNKKKTPQILYIGKAHSLKKRITQYLHSEHYKTHFMMSCVTDIDWIVTNNENEALLLESNLIKKYNPPFNVRLKDNKKYPFLCLTMGEKFPRLILTRRQTNPKNHYFGPFANVKSARNIMRLIHKIFPIRKRPLKLPLKNPVRPCLNFHIKRCWAPCTGQVASKDYRIMIEQVDRLLNGNIDELKQSMKNQMQHYAQKTEYEKAKYYRDMLNDLDTTLLSEQTVHHTDESKNCDIIALVYQTAQQLRHQQPYISLLTTKDEPYYFAQIVLLSLRDGKLVNKQSFALSEMKIIPVEENSIHTTFMESFLREYYLSFVDIPSYIYLTKGILQPEHWSEILSNRHKKTIQLMSLEYEPSIKEQYASLFNMAKENAQLSLQEQFIIESMRASQQALKELQSLLQLSELPINIEAYDISNLQGTYAVASGVAFKDGLPHKALYRKYRIKYVKGIDDPRMIHEVITRRLAKKDIIPLPNLIIIDGGITQLQAALKARNEAGVNINIVSLAKKREEVYLTPHKKLSTDINQPAMLIMRAARDEAHRFALSYHRKLRDQGAFAST